MVARIQSSNINVCFENISSHFSFLAKIEDLNKKYESWGEKSKSFTQQHLAKCVSFQNEGDSWTLMKEVKVLTAAAATFAGAAARKLH